MARNRIRSRSTIALIILRSTLLVLAATAFLIAVASAPERLPLRIPRGEAPTIDGVMDRDDWSRAVQVPIHVERDWTVTAFLKHHADNLYVAFEGVEHGLKRVFPEVMVDPQMQRGEKWSPGQLWLHVSTNLCEGAGECNVYERNGVFQCAHTKPGWEGNNPPHAGEIIEMRVSFSKMDLASPIGKTVGMALDVTDATGKEDQLFRYWPATANISRPSSWGTALIE